MKHVKKKNNKNFEYLIKGIYAGFMISIGTIIYLSVENKIIGSFLFSFGLLIVCIYGMNLYTGKIGYIISNRKLEYIKEIIIGLIGNLIGAFICGKLISLTRNNIVIENAKKVSQIKLNDNILSIFLLSFFCGIMIYLAVNNYKKINDVIGKYIGIFMGVMIFILSGFEHCVANVSYFSIASCWNLKTIIYLIIMIVGNACGSIFISYFDNLCKKIK